MSHWVFVYGTLKKGEPNYQVMTEGQGTFVFKGTARICRRYPLIISTKYNIPFLLKNPDHGEFVEGELYLVDDAKLSQLDELENHPHFYVRHEDQFKLISDENGKELTAYEDVTAWVYMLPSWRPELITEGTPPQQRYSSYGPHGRPYVEKYLRDQDEQREKHSLIDIVRGSRTP